jgi:hypothetical protein
MARFLYICYRGAGGVYNDKRLNLSIEYVPLVELNSKLADFVKTTFVQIQGGFSSASLS